MLDLIRDEVNVKEIVFDDTIEGEVQLDVNLTEELKQEGKNNEALRAYNDMRKEGGYIPQMYVVNVSSTMAVFSDPERRKEMKIENFHKISSKEEIEPGYIVREVKDENGKTDLIAIPPNPGKK